MKNKKLSDVDNYLKAIDDFNNPERKKELLKHQYPDIEWFSYNINKFTEYRVRRFADRIKNSIIDLNRKNTMEWWEQLSPYQFEKEIVQWYVNKGYKAKVTVASGDGGERFCW